MELGLRVGDRSWGEEKAMSLDDASTRDPRGRSIPFLSLPWFNASCTCRVWLGDRKSLISSEIAFIFRVVASCCSIKKIHLMLQHRWGVDLTHYTPVPYQ